MSKAQICALPLDQTSALFGASTSSVDMARRLLANANPTVVAMVEKGLVSFNIAPESYENFHQLAKAESKEAPRNQDDEHDYQALAHEIKKLRERNANLAKDKTSRR